LHPTTPRRKFNAFNENGLPGRDNHEWLLQGEVFTPDVVETWLSYKRERELAAVNLRPVPYEFYLYFDL
jgi:glutamine synthetase